MRAFRTRSLARIAALFLLVTLAGCSPQSTSNPVDEAMNILAGKWKVISLDRSGKKSDTKALKDMIVTVEGDKLRFEEVPPASDLVKGDVMTKDIRIEQYILQVNPAKSGDIDFIYEMGENQGKTRPGLYAFEGETLKICLAPVGKSRPEQISPDRDLTVFYLMRQP